MAIDTIAPEDELTAMDAAHLRELIELEDSYWWHQAKRQLLLTLIRQHFPKPMRVLEGGIGSSRNLIELGQRGYQVTGLDIMPEAVSHARQRGLEDVHEHDLTLPWPVEPTSIGVVVLLDVIEHVPDPVCVLQHAHRCLQPGGGVIVTVPAYPALYGDWDKQLGHYRRYTKHTLQENARDAGFRVEWLNHWNSFTLPPALLIRSYQKRFPKDRPAEFPRVSSITNQMLGSLAAAERCLMKRLPIPCGLSLAGIFMKQE